MKSSIVKEQLGIAHSTAAKRLLRMLLFKLAIETDSHFCYQCGEEIETLKEFTIEHIEPWYESDDPVGLYFDLDNIAFSHQKCNSGARRNTKKKED